MLSKPCPSDILFTAIEHCLNEKTQELDIKQPAKKLEDIRVLVVEDNEINQVVINHLLQENGAVVIIANHGKAALELLEQNDDFQVILMDIQMPEMDGIQATKIIRAQANPKVAKMPIIALSANVLEKDVASYLAVGDECSQCETGEY
ncbi:response regulator [Paraglaciecola aestuariivivens]